MELADIVFANEFVAIVFPPNEFVAIVFPPNELVANEFVTIEFAPKEFVANAFEASELADNEFTKEFVDIVFDMELSTRIPNGGSILGFGWKLAPEIS